MSTTATIETKKTETIYPLNTPEGNVYVKHPVQVGETWRAGNVTSVGFSIPLDGVSFATERECQILCDVHNQFHFAKEEVESIIRASMVSSLKSKNPLIMARDMADILFGQAGMFPAVLDKQQKNRVENVLYAMLKDIHQTGSDAEMELLLLRGRMNKVREKMATISIANPQSRAAIAHMFELLNPASYDTH